MNANQNVDVINHEPRDGGEIFDAYSPDEWGVLKKPLRIFLYKCVVTLGV